MKIPFTTLHTQHSVIPQNTISFSIGLPDLQADLADGERSQAEFKTILKARVDSLGSQLEAAHATLQHKVKDLDACHSELVALQVTFPTSPPPPALPP